ncbi:hypothetical protein H4R19_001183 [Coemansia spiralis]|nr:hypothetical protein H4R19_001183 [Coemansia spiralis]
MLKDNGALLRQLKGGVLYKNGDQTSCQLAVLDSESAAVSADCLHLGPDGQLSPNTTHFAYLDSGADGVTDVYAVRGAVVHPKYNAHSRSNNIAVLMFNTTRSQLAWQMPIAAPPNTPADRPAAFVRYAVADATTLMWRWPPYVHDWAQPDSRCTSMSRLYANNADALWCTDSDVMTAADSAKHCAIPLGTMVALTAPDKIALVGLYSYGAVEGKIATVCSKTQMRSYFTALAPYVPFFESVLGRSLAFDGKRGPSDYAMAEADPSLNPVDTQMVGGDVFAANKLGSPALADGTGSDPSQDGLDPDSGLTKSAIIIIVVCSTVGGLLIVCAVAFILYRRRRRARSAAGQLKSGRVHGALQDDLGPDSVSPFTTARQHHPQRSIEDIRNALDHEMPPMYEDAIDLASPRDSMVAAAGTKWPKGSSAVWREY